MLEELISWDIFLYSLLFLWAFLPLLYKLLFGLYTIQLKEYRLDRFKEYIFTPQWKKGLFNFWFILELILFLMLFLVFILNSFSFFKIENYLIFIYIFFLVFFILESIFVLIKIKKKNILKPKITSRLLIIIGLFIIWWAVDIYFILFWWYYIYSFLYILLVFLTMPLIIFFYNLLSLPLVNYKKNKQINSAIKKSKKIDEVIKIWITGSYGKSSVKEFLSSILEQNTPPSLPLEGGVLKTPENQNTEMSVSALILNKLNNSYKYFIAEMGAYKIWEISILWKIVNHKYWFLTAIWNQHIWLFGSQENIVKGKFEILEKVIENNWILYVNVDNQNIEKYLNSPISPFHKGDKQVSLNIVKYWINWEKLDAKSEILEINNLKTKFSFNYKKNKEEFETNLIWKHNILNLTWILAFCYDIWLETENLKKYLLNIKSPKNTWEIIKKNDLILIDDTYNLSEAGLKSWIDLLKYFKNKEKILVLDDILELWKESEEIHYNIAKEIAENKLVNKVIFCWSNYKKSFVDWLIKWWFEQESILSTKGFSPLKNSVILFEGRNAKKYLNKLSK